MEESNNLIRKIINGPSLGYTDVFHDRETWNEIANELHGEFKVKLTSGNELEMHTLSIPYKKWNIGISISDTRPLKFEISFPSSKDFLMLLSWEDLIDRIRKRLGKKEIEIGWDEFDNHYLIESNKPEWFKEVCTNEIQILFLKHNIYSLSYKSELETNRAELTSVIQRNAGDKAMILELIGLFKSLIDKLEHLNIIE